MAYTEGTQLKHEVGYYVTIANGALDGTGDYSWANIGFTEMAGSFNPTTQESQYIGQSNKTTLTTSLAPQWAFSCQRVTNDPVNDDLNEICLKKLTGELQPQRSFVRADLKNPHESKANWYKAIRATMNVNIDSFDQGAPGEVVYMSGNYSVSGDVVEGWFNIVTKKWSSEEPTE